MELRLSWNYLSRRPAADGCSEQEELAVTVLQPHFLPGPMQKWLERQHLVSDRLISPLAFVCKPPFTSWYESCGADPDGMPAVREDETRHVLVALYLGRCRQWGKTG